MPESLKYFVWKYIQMLFEYLSLFKLICHLINTVWKPLIIINSQLSLGSFKCELLTVHSLTNWFLGIISETFTLFVLVNQSIWWKWNVKCSQEIVFSRVPQVWMNQTNTLVHNEILQQSYPNNFQIMYLRMSMSLWICLNCSYKCFSDQYDSRCGLLSCWFYIKTSACWRYVSHSQFSLSGNLVFHLCCWVTNIKSLFSSESLHKYYKEMIHFQVWNKDVVSES